MSRPRPLVTQVTDPLKMRADGEPLTALQLQLIEDHRRLGYKVGRPLLKAPTDCVCMFRKKGGKKHMAEWDWFIIGLTRTACESWGRTQVPMEHW